MIQHGGNDRGYDPHPPLHCMSRPSYWKSWLTTMPYSSALLLLSVSSLQFGDQCCRPGTLPVRCSCFLRQMPVAWLCISFCSAFFRLRKLLILHPSAVNKEKPSSNGLLADMLCPPVSVYVWRFTYFKSNQRVARSLRTRPSLPATASTVPCFRLHMISFSIFIASRMTRTSPLHYRLTWPGVTLTSRTSSRHRRCYGSVCPLLPALLELPVPGLPALAPVPLVSVQDREPPALPGLAAGAEGAAPASSTSTAYAVHRLRLYYTFSYLTIPFDHFLVIFFLELFCSRCSPRVAASRPQPSFHRKVCWIFLATRSSGASCALIRRDRRGDYRCQIFICGGMIRCIRRCC